MKKYTHHPKLRKTTILFLTAVSVSCIASGCKKEEHEKIDLSTVHTTAAETMAETTASETSQADADIQLGDSSSDQADAHNVSTTLQTYEKGEVSIQYPSVVNLDNGKAEDIDQLLKKNALAILDAWDINPQEDALDIDCQVMSADRNRITVCYSGSYTAKDAAYPSQIFYSNTIDVSQVSDIGFSQLADPYTMAGYVLSDDCEFHTNDKNLEAELLEYKNTQSIQYYTDLFNKADFPISGTFPESFSYEHEGTIFFSIPVPHALGDYAIVKYTPDTK